MAEVENHFTVFIRLPFNRGDFVDPPPVSWSAAKERALWEVISRQGQGKGNDIDWHELASRFEVTQPFILQQAAWLYERQLSQVRAQLRKVGNRTSAAPSPIPGSMNSSSTDGQSTKRLMSGGSRVPSRLSTQHTGSPIIGAAEGNTSPIPAKSRPSLPLRTAPGVQAPRSGSGSYKPLSRQPSKESNPPGASHSRRGSIQHQLSRSPGQRKASPIVPNSDSDEEEDIAQSKLLTRRTNPSSLHRRSVSLRKDLPMASDPKSASSEEDSPNFLPFAADPANAISRQSTHSSSQDPSATIRGGFAPSLTSRPSAHRRSTSERIVSPTSATTAIATSKTVAQTAISPTYNTLTTTTSPSSSSLSSPPLHPSAPPNPQTNPPSRPGALSPRQQASLASALSPNQNSSSSQTPSITSSFSDLDDASVTQSALEEALMTGMGSTTATVASRVGSTMGMGMGGIGQALRSRYLDGAQGQSQGQTSSRGARGARGADQSDGRGRGANV